MKQIFIALILLSSLSACKKEEVKNYEGGDRVQFSRQSTNPAIPYIDSLSFSFTTKGSKVFDTLAIPVDITGRVADTDREIKVELITGESSAKAGVDFDFGRGVIKAGQSKGFFALILRKTPELETQRKVVAFRIVESDQFKPGIVKQLKCKVAFFNFLVKPIDWDTRLFRYFGTYSKVKYRFILYHLGYPELNFANSGVPEDPSKYLFGGTKFSLFQLKVRAILNDLNAGTLKPDANNPFTYPLMDENGQAVVIP
ncbi:hypothetical protein D3C87_1309710 [compost metagenome]